MIDIFDPIVFEIVAMFCIGLFFLRVVNRIDRTNQACDGLRGQPAYWGAYETNECEDPDDYVLTPDEIIRTI